jgi:dipeptidase E
LCGLGWKSLGILELTALASIEKEVWAATAQESDDETAVKVVDGTVEVVSEGHWKLFNP